MGRSAKQEDRGRIFPWPAAPARTDLAGAAGYGIHFATSFTGGILHEPSMIDGSFSFGQ